MGVIDEREEIARREVGHTAVSLRLATVMVIWFLLMLVALPALEIVGGREQAEAGTPWAEMRALPGAIRDGAAAAGASAWETIVAGNRAALARFNAFETALEDRSAVGRLLRPPTQLLLTRWAGAGNERVYIGRDGWLFYRADVEHLTRRGFLNADEARRRVASASEYERQPHPDPRPAIVQFHRDLATRGITLVVMPTPVKPTLHPERLTGQDAAAGAPVQNASYEAFVQELSAQGVLVFDAARAIASRPAADAAHYLATDTHWRPETMQHVVGELAEYLRGRVSLPPRGAPMYTAQPREARSVGDTAAMLNLPDTQMLYPPERVTLRFIVDAAGDPWQPDPSADVLVLGDSFTNIYSLGTMGWGESAGFAEQLSFALQRPVDRIVQNDQGAVATRALLARDLESGRDRLAGKRVVVWQFAARELTFGDWRPIPLRAR
jgi:hypothetical protein